MPRAKHTTDTAETANPPRGRAPKITQVLVRNHGAIREFIKVTARPGSLDQELALRNQVWAELAGAEATPFELLTIEE